MSALLSSVSGTEAPHNVLATWQARDAEARARMKGFGLPRPADVAGRTGLQIFEAMLAGEIVAPPIARTLDFLVVEASAGRVVFQGRPHFDHYNPLGTVHGGWIATLLDSAVACSIHSMLPLGKTYTTLELKVNFVKGLTDKVPLVRAIGEVIHCGGRTGTAEGRLVGPDGTLFAHATTTCLIMEMPAR